MDKEILVDGKKIFYRVTGTGKPVVLLHGFGEDGEIWNHQVAFLKDQFQLIVPDLPGSGQSEMSPDMSIEGMAETVNTLLDKELGAHEEGHSQKVTLIGHSMGGYIVLAFAEKYAGRLNAWGLFHSTAWADSEEKKATRQKGIAFIREHGAFEFLKTATPNLFSQQTRDERPELIDEQISGLSNFSATALVKYYESMMQRPDRSSILKKSGVPVLFIMGKYDTAVPLEDALQQCHLPGKSYIHILHESGHMGMLEETGKSNRILKQFLLEI